MQDAAYNEGQKERDAGPFVHRVVLLTRLINKSWGFIQGFDQTECNISLRIYVCIYTYIYIHIYKVKYKNKVRP